MSVLWNKTWLHLWRLHNDIDDDLRFATLDGDLVLAQSLNFFTKDQTLIQNNLVLAKLFYDVFTGDWAECCCSVWDDCTNKLERAW